jgi:peptidoglycan/xylan/chitin deacetylase (PgdA/CDA1 family)
MIEGPLKRVIFRALEGLGVISISEILVRGTTILAYHGVTERQNSPLTNLRRLHTGKGRFEEHLRLLSSRWHPVPLSALWEALEMGRSLPHRSVIVTIDDGYRNILTTALPLLKRFAVPATLFVVTGPERERRMWIDRLEAAIDASSVHSLQWGGRTFPLTSISEKAEAIRVLVGLLAGIGTDRESVLERVRKQLGNPPEHPDPDRDLLSWNEVCTLRAAGLEIGSHAHFHEPLTELPFEEARSGLLKSRETLERELGPGHYALSYPYGAWNESLAEAAREAGFSCAVTGDPGLVRGVASPFSLKRILIGADDDIARLRASLGGLRALGQPRRSWAKV